MRIIAGSAKGRIIKAPAGMATRPTSDKVREAIFSSIGDIVSGSLVLDLFAGSGALGLEALSRGARKTIFVDFSLKAIKTINSNLANLDFADSAEVKRQKAERFLDGYNNEPFNLIFLDAPYKIGLINLAAIVQSALKLLDKEGLMIVEHDAKVKLSEKFPVIKSKKYGQTMISYLEKD